MKGLTVALSFTITSLGFAAELSGSCIQKLSGEFSHESGKLVYGEAKRANPIEIEGRIKRYREANRIHHQGLFYRFQANSGCEHFLKSTKSAKRDHLNEQMKNFMKFLDDNKVGSDILSKCKDIDKAFATKDLSSIETRNSRSSAIASLFLDKREKALSNILGKAAGLIEKDYDSVGIPKDYNSVQQVQSGSITFTVYSLDNKVISVARRGEFQEASDQFFEMAQNGECKVSKVHRGKVTMDLALCDEFEGYEKDIRNFDGNFFPISSVEILLKQKQNPKDRDLKKSADEIRKILREDEYNSVLRIGSYLSSTRNKFHKDQNVNVISRYLAACEDFNPNESPSIKKSTKQVKRM